MDRERLNSMRKKMELDGKVWEATVFNFEPVSKTTIQTKFDGRFEKIENILQKVEADLMTNLHMGIQTPIAIVIKEKVNEGIEI